MATITIEGKVFGQKKTTICGFQPAGSARNGKMGESGSRCEPCWQAWYAKKSACLPNDKKSGDWCRC